MFMRTSTSRWGLELVLVRIEEPRVYSVEHIQRINPGERTTWEACSDMQVLDSTDKTHRFGGESQNIA